MSSFLDSLISTWQTDPFCGCCQEILVCSMSGATLGYKGCSMHLEWEYNILCCEYTIWLVCDCTGQRGFYMINRGSGCGPDPSCFSPNPDDFKNTKIDKNKEYVYYLDPKTKENFAFTFDEIASKKYKVNYPDMPDLDLNQKVTFDNKNMTIYDVLKPKRFLFSVNPNPFEGSPNISLFISKIGENDKGILKVTDALGRILLTQQLDNLHEGENLIMPNLSNFNSGIYFITIQVNDKIETKKVYKK